MAIKETHFHIDGMTCQACATRIEKVLNKKDAIVEANVNFATEDADIRYDSAYVQPEEIAQWIRALNYQPKPITKSPANLDNAHTMPWRVILLIVIALPFFIAMLGLLWKKDWTLPVPVQFLLSTIVQFWLGWSFYKSAIASVRGGVANMDVLVVLGTVVMWLYSTITWYFDKTHILPLYFETNILVIAFVSVGKYIEHRSKRQSLNSLSMLLDMTPESVSIHRENDWITVPLSQVQVGDTIRAIAGGKIAADGVIVDGALWCDERHLTGEPAGISKKPGDKVLAGAIVTDGSATYRAESLGYDTQLGDMMRALSNAQRGKAPIARIADKITMIFVPVVITIALLTFTLTWLSTGDIVHAIVNAVAVLVVACPCAMGLATPAAIMVGMGEAIRHGIWFRDAPAIEAGSTIDTIVLDKTGTLTKGEPSVSAIWCANEYTDEAQLLKIAATIEQHVQHPLARAIIAAAQSRDIALPHATNITMTVGEGIAGDIDQVGRVRVGKLDTPPIDDGAWLIASLVGIWVDDQLLGAFAITDTLRDDSIAAVEQLQKARIEVMILSGDNPQVVAHIANILGITQFKGHLTPREKAEIISALKAKGKRVAMVGDGANDAPALASADVSFALRDGSDIAENVASATLMRQSVSQISDALFISRAVLRNVKENLFFAFFYNFLAIPLAAIGLLNPVIAAAAMALSSFSVIGNALRLKRLKLPSTH